MFLSSLPGSLLLALLLLLPPQALAEDVLRRYRLTDGVPKRLDYAELVLEQAMKRTQPKYGPYRIESRSGRIGREELLEQMRGGDEVNVAVVASQPAWELQMLPIYIPVDMGLSNYRIALTTVEAQPKLSAARTLTDLGRLRVGVGRAWSSRRVLEIAGFAVQTEDSFNPLLDSLMAGRIDYFPRGLNEVFVEFEEVQHQYPRLRIEQDVLLVFPLPGYVFVSPAYPRLHKRLSEGLELMVRDGSLRRLATRYHADMLKQARVCERTVFRIENPNLHNPQALLRKELWFDPMDPRNGFCPRPPKLS